MLRSLAMSFSASQFHGGLSRREMIPFIPTGSTTILDVGCSHGLFGSELKRTDPKWSVAGIEPDPEAAKDAMATYDDVICGFYPVDIPSAAQYDCIVFNDVLEHVTDPWGMLRQTHGHLAPNGRIVASIPNVRYVMVVRDLLFRGRWEYADWGVLDRTHLRFFTRKSIEDLFATTGYVIESLTPINPIRLRRAALIAGRFRDMRYPQFAVVARDAGTSA
jgi:2-polyprenyl-3-methyl-5-hydroxy-6-metoxy-1,4-benzoquinol methylase